MSGLGLTDLSDASHFNERGLPLPLCKASSLVTIRVDASKSFAVLVKQSRLIMMVFSPSVFPECCALPNFHFEKYITLNSSSTNEPFPFWVIACCARWWWQAKS